MYPNRPIVLSLLGVLATLGLAAAATAQNVVTYDAPTLSNTNVLTLSGTIHLNRIAPGLNLIILQEAFLAKKLDAGSAAEKYGPRDDADRIEYTRKGNVFVVKFRNIVRPASGSDTYLFTLDVDCFKVTGRSRKKMARLHQVVKVTVPATGDPTVGITAVPAPPPGAPPNPIISTPLAGDNFTAPFNVDVVTDVPCTVVCSILCGGMGQSAVPRRGGSTTQHYFQFFDLHPGECMISVAATDTTTGEATTISILVNVQ